MNLDCPKCGARFLVDVTFPVDGRRVRCTRCANVWRAMPTVPRTTLLHPSDLGLSSQGGQTDVSLSAINEAADRRDAIVARDFGDAEAVPSVQAQPQHRRRRGLLEALSGIDKISQQDDADAALPEQRPEMAPPHAPPARTVHAFQPALAVSLDQEAAPERRPRRFVLGMAFTILAIAAGFALQVYVLTPARMIRTIPASADLYRALGVVISRQGLTIGRLSINAASVGSRQLLAISADIENAGHKSVRVPRIVVSVVGVGGRRLSSADARVKAITLAPGEHTRLQVELPTPESAPYRVQARFSNAQEKH